MSEHADVLLAYLRHLKCANPSQSTRPRWCEIHAALIAGANALNGSRPHPAPVGVRVPAKRFTSHDGMVGTTAANDIWNECINEVLRLNPQPGAVVGLRDIALRNLRRMIELGSTDKELMLANLEELS